MKQKLKIQGKLFLAIIIICISYNNSFSQQSNGATVPVRGVGVVVKKNPGGPSRLSNTDANGITNFELTEAGDFTFTLSQPTTRQGGNTVRNRTQKEEVATAKTVGGPVTGVRMGLGKNPSGAIITTQTTNTSGEVTFTNLQAGSYFIRIMPTETSPLNSTPRN